MESVPSTTPTPAQPIPPINQTTLRPKKRFSLVLLLIALLFFTLIIGVIALISNTPVNLIKTFDCADPEALLNYIVSITNNQELDIQKNAQDKFDTLEWKRSNTEPFITYKVANLAKVYFKNNTLTEIRKFFDSDLANQFEKYGFIKDPLNNLENNLPNQEIKVWHYGFIKNKSIYKLTLEENKYPEYDEKKYKSYVEYEKIAKNTPFSNIVCGYKSKEEDKLYDELLAQPALNDKFNYTAPVFDINKREPNFVRASIYTLDAGMGIGIYLLKTGDKWESLASGQNVPRCKILEDNKVGHDLDCYDDLSPNTIRKTK